jgi:hypothetical protein
VSNYNDVRTALGASVTAYQPGVNVYYYVPRSLVPPAAIVQPQPHRTIDYMQAQSSTMARWYFNVLLVIGQVDEQAAQEQAGDLISPGSGLIQALNDTTLPSSGYVVVTDGAISEMATGGGSALYTYAQLSVSVYV